jgi:hypothetical protein
VGGRSEMVTVSEQLPRATRLAEAPCILLGLGAANFLPPLLNLLGKTELV